jgi:hypothetical protein
MALQNFVDKVGPTLSAAWLNGVDILNTTVFGNATTKSAARTALTSDAPMSVAQGGTGLTTATGYLLGSGSSVTASPTIPGSVITGSITNLSYLSVVGGGASIGGGIALTGNITGNGYFGLTNNINVISTLYSPTPYNFAVTDANATVVNTVAGNGFNLTSGVTFPVGTVIEVVNNSSGIVTISTSGLSTLYAYSTGISGYINVPAYTTMRLLQYATNTWLGFTPTIAYTSLSVFNATLTGGTTTPTGGISYSIIGQRVCLKITTAFTITSNSTAFTFTGLPAALQPNRTVIVPCPITSSGNVLSGWATLTASSGTVTFGLTTPNGAFVNDALAKGLPTGWQLIYDLN